MAHSGSISYKNVPKLNDKIQYEVWVKELKLWSMCCKLEKKEQGPAVVISLEGNARQAALDIDMSVLNSDDGLQAVINKLNGLYLKDENQRIYVALKTFEKYQRPAEESIDNYLNKFDLMYCRLKNHKIILPDAVLAYRLLESANLEKSKSDLVRATIKQMSFDEMKTQLRKLEDIAVTSVRDDGGFQIKEEPDDVLYNQRFSNQRGGRSSRGRGGRSLRGAHGGGFSNRGNYNNNDSSRNFNTDNTSSNSRGNFNNYRGRGGRNRGRGACFNCQSTQHWARDCPIKPPQELGDDEEGDNEEQVEIVDIEI